MCGGSVSVLHHTYPSLLAKLGILAVDWQEDVKAIQNSSGLTGLPMENGVVLTVWWFSAILVAIAVPPS